MEWKEDRLTQRWQERGDVENSRFFFLPKEHSSRQKTEGIKKKKKKKLDLKKPSYPICALRLADKALDLEIP